MFLHKYKQFFTRLNPVLSQQKIMRHDSCHGTITSDRFIFRSNTHTISNSINL